MRAAGCVAIRQSTNQGATHESRAAFTVQDWRARSSERVRALSRRKIAQRAQQLPRSEPPTSRAIFNASIMVSATGSERYSFRRFSDGTNSPDAR